MDKDRDKSNMMTALRHQIKYGQKYKDKELVVHETGSGKTICAALWLGDGRDKDALVVCPKRIKDKWDTTLYVWDTKATILTKEQFKKASLKKWSAIVIDEADEYASPLFTKNRSQLSTKLYELVKMQPETPILLLTATPVRSNPWNLHTLLCFLGVYIDYKKWRDRFFSLERRPFLPRPAWMPKTDWRTDIRPVLEKYSDIVLLKDCVGELPPITERVVDVPSGVLQRNPEWEPSAAFVAEHRHEQLNKPAEIMEIGKNYRKVLVVAHFVEQVETLKK